MKGYGDHRTNTSVSCVRGAVGRAYIGSADHRIIDGAAAARFLATLVQLLETPLRVLS